MDVMPVDKRVRRLRAMALVHALCNLLGCRHNGTALAVCWRQHHQVFDVQLNRKWPSFFKGVTPRENLRKQIYLDFPQLRALFDNPLWFALSGDGGEGREWDRLAECIRVGTLPLDAFNGNASLLLFSRVDWPCLGLMVILLRTRSLRFQLHRRWLQLNFAMIFALACIQTPLMEIRLELYGVLNNLLRHALVDIDIECFNNWPRDVEGFVRMLDFFRVLANSFTSLHWLRTGEHRALLLWMVLGFNNALELYAELRANKRPRNLKRLWDRQYPRWCKSSIALGDYRVPMPD